MATVTIDDVTIHTNITTTLNPMNLAIIGSAASFVICVICEKSPCHHCGGTAPATASPETRMATA